MNFAIDSGARWIKIIWAMGGLVALALMPLPMMAGLGALGIAGAIILWKRRRFAAFWNEIKPIWPLLVVLALFYFSPFTNVAPSMRAPGAYISIYTYLGGVISVMGIVLISALAIAIVCRLKEGKINLAIGAWRGFGFFFFLILVAFIIGLLHAEGGLLHYGVTELKRPIIAFVPPFYMLAVFMLVVNFVRSQEHLARLLAWMDRLTILLIGYGIYRLLMILAYGLETMWMFGLPIVLYDEMAMLYVPIFTIAARWLAGQKTNRWQAIQLVIMILFILCSTRRYNYLLLVMGLFLVALVGYSSRIFSLRRLHRLAIRSVLVFGIAAFLLLALAPKFSQGVLAAFESLDVSSRVGQKHGGEIRLAIIKNMFANLDRRPYAYLSGFGLGTMWQAIEYQPMDSLTKKLRKNDGWYAVFSIPYVSLFFRLGILGTLALLFWLFYYLRARAREMRFMDGSLQSYGMGMIAYVGLIIPALADSLNPTGWILCGLYMGILERLTLAANHLAPAAAENESQHHSP